VTINIIHYNIVFINRYINHSCMPNAKVVKMVFGVYPFIVIRSIREIQCGEEITIDYREDYNHVRRLRYITHYVFPGIAILVPLSEPCELLRYGFTFFFAQIKKCLCGTQMCRDKTVAQSSLDTNIDFDYDKLFVPISQKKRRKVSPQSTSFQTSWFQANDKTRDCIRNKVRAAFKKFKESQQSESLIPSTSSGSSSSSPKPSTSKSCKKPDSESAQLPFSFRDCQVKLHTCPKCYR